MDAGSYHEFGKQQTALRQEALANLRAAKRSIGNLRREFEVCWREFIRRLDATPRQVVYRYYQTRNALLDQLDRVDDVRSLLTRPRRGERLLSKGHLLNRAAVAQRIVGNLSALEPAKSRPMSRSATAKEAIRALQGRRSDLELKLAALERSWGELVGAAQSVLRCVKELSRRGVVATDDRAIIYLEEALFYYFDKELARPHRTALQRKMATKAKAAFATLPVRKVFHQALGDAAGSAAAGIPIAVAWERDKLLHDAAGQIVARLEAWRERPRCSELEQAILSLHFTFSSARCGWGGIGTHDLRRCQTALEEANEMVVFSAVRSLVQQDVLSDSDFEFFRYTPTVWQAWNRLRQPESVDMLKCSVPSDDWDGGASHGRHRAAQLLTRLS